MQVRAAFLILFLLLAVTPSVSGQGCQKEQEPNDDPLSAIEFGGGCLAGQLGAQEDGQDLWRWVVGPDQPRWRLTLDGVEGGLTNVEILRVTLDGDRVTRSERLYRLGTVAEPVVGEVLLLPGEYVLGIAADGAAGDYRLDLEPLPLPASGEVEPNSQQSPQPLAGDFDLAGQGDADYFDWELDGAQAAQRWDLTLIPPLGTRYEMALLEPGGDLIARLSRSQNPVYLADLALAAGRYLIRVTAPSVDAGTPYLLSARPTGPREPTLEEEPNLLESPYEIAPAGGVRGRLTGDEDHFSFTPERPFTRIRLRDESGEERSLCLYTGSGRKMQCRSGRGEIEMGTLRLEGARYLLGVDGPAAPNSGYEIDFLDQPVPPPNRESEPNDDHWFAPDLPESHAVRGHLTGSERDIYRLVTEGRPQLWRVQVQGAGVRRLQILDASGRPLPLPTGTSGGRARLSNILLLPGTHYLAVHGEESDYLLRVLSQGVPDPNVESEPNDRGEYALPLRFDQPRRGILTAGDVDLYRFRLAATERIRLTATPPADGQLRLTAPDGQTIMASSRSVTGEPVLYEGTLLPGDYTVRLMPTQGSESAYRIRLERLAPFTAAAGASRLPGLNLQVRLEAAGVAAYSTWSQRLEGSVTLTNRGSGPLTVRLTSHISDDGWQVTMEEGAVTVAAGAERLLPLRLDIAPDAFAGIPVILTLWAEEAAGDYVDTSTMLLPTAETPLADPALRFPLPDALLGALDVASSGLGATILTSEPRLAERQAALHRSHTPDSTQERLAIATNGVPPLPLPQTLTVRLAGEEAVAVAGFALHPQGPAGTEATGSQPADILLLLSSDDQSYQQVYAGRLAPRRAEQYIVLERPVQARYARLVIQSTQEDTGRLVLDSWKVLAVPGAAGGRNLADPALGGRMVYIAMPGEREPRYDFALPQSPLTEEPPPWLISCRESCDPPQWVVAFQEQRAARISRVEWVDSPALAAGEQWPEAVVYGSLDSPAGPWERLGVIDLGGTPPGTHVLTPESPVWVRYLRFELPVAGRFSQRPLPAVVRAIEQVEEEGYRSILGEWGWAGRNAVYEWQNPPLPAAAGAVTDDDDDRPEQATPLVGSTSGQVQVEIDEDWVQVDIPPDANTLRLTVRGQPAVSVALDARDDAGGAIPLRPDAARSGPTVQSWEATVVPGTIVRLRIYEPPRSVIFAWDTSGSVFPFLPMIYQSLERFAAGVRGGREAVNLLPFGRDLLLDGWEDDPTLIVQGLQNFDRATESSETADNLFSATEALAARPGSRAVVLIGDFDLVQREQSALWRLLALVQPSIYSLRVAHLRGRGQSQMEVWGAINNGGAWETPTVSTLEVGFERAATRLRQPADYTLAAETLFTAPPGPGTLQVVTQLVERESEAAPTALGGTAVEVILDASGSMQQALQGSTRLAIARDVLSDLVTRVLPPQTPLALRVFGHIEGDFSCRTDLVLPLARHDPVDLQRTIQGIVAQNRAGTPLAASLAKVAEDLANVEGRKLIILLTDGEESCGGNPAEEIERLRAAGIDVRVTIVGFAINDAELAAQFQEWARIGGGDYISAGSAEELNQAIAEAVRVPYRVIDATGAEVATGSVNGEAVTLPAGIYTVELLSEPVRQYEVTVAGDDETRLAVDR